MKNTTFPIFILVISSCFWGLSWLPLKYLHEAGFDGLLINFYVYLVMFVLTAGFIYRFKSDLKKYWWALFAVMLLGGGAQLAFNSAMIYGDVIRAMVLFYMLPIWGVIGGRLFLGEKITKIRWLAMGFSVIGAFLVIGGFNAFDTPPTWIDALALAAGFLFAMNNVVFRATPEASVLLKVPFMFLGAVLLSLIAIVYLEQPAVPQVSANAWWALLAFAGIWMLLSNLGTQWAVTQIESGKSSIILILELITAVVSASLILGEVMAPLEMFGGFLILSAALLETLGQQPEEELLDKTLHQNKQNSPLKKAV